MRNGRAFNGVIVAVLVVTGCAAAGPGGSGVAAPAATAVPPFIVGAGLPTQPAEQWLEGPAMAATAIGAPLHGLGCAGTALVSGFFYALYFPGDISDEFKALIAQSCAGPYVVTPAEVARVPQPFPVRALRTPRTGTLPVEEVVRRPMAPR